MTGHALQLDIFKILELPRDLLERIGGFLNSNERVCTLRLVNKAFAALYRGPGQRPVVRLSEPVPHHAFAACCMASSRAWVKALTFDRRVKLLCFTAASGDLTNLELAVGAAGCVLTGMVMGAAAAAGHIHVCLWLRQRGCPWGYALESAAKAGRWKVCEWLLASGCPGNPIDLQDRALWRAAESGNVEFLDWLVGRGCDLTRVWDGTFINAARGGCVAMLERLVELGCHIPDDGGPYSSAAISGDLATLRCLRRLGCPWDPTGNLITEVIRENWPYCPLLPSLRLLVEAGCPVDWAEALKVLRGAPRWEDRAEVTGWLVEGLQRSRSRQGAGAVTRPTTGAGRLVGWLVGWLGLPSV